MSFIPRPERVHTGDEYLVCSHSHHGYESIHHSESSEDRAERSVDAMNMILKDQGKREKYFWRPVNQDEMILVSSY